MIHPSSLVPKKPVSLQEKTPEVLPLSGRVEPPQVPVVAPLLSDDFSADEGEYFNFEI